MNRMNLDALMDNNFIIIKNMKTRIIQRQKNFDIKRFMPQFKGWYWLLGLIPIKIWKDFEYEFGDAILLGLPLTSREFNTRSEAEIFLKNTAENV